MTTCTSSFINRGSQSRRISVQMRVRRGRGWEMRVWGMQITWKGYRESGDEKRRGRVNIAGVCGGWSVVACKHEPNGEQRMQKEKSELCLCRSVCRAQQIRDHQLCHANFTLAVFWIWWFGLQQSLWFLQVCNKQVTCRERGQVMWKWSGATLQVNQNHMFI